MFLKQALCKCDKIRMLGNRILMNHNYKYNLYNSPTATYEDFSRHQNELIEEMKKEVSELHRKINKTNMDKYKITPF